jgi:two-component system sensor histidine kinase CpxA
MNEIIEDARMEAGAAEKTVDWSSPKEAMIVEGDHGLLRSAIENVLRNAVRFTKPSSAVKVRADRSGPQVSIVIDDRGPGVPEPDLQRIFEPFYRVADSGGTGLGLAITARIVSLYGGNVRARNTADGLRVEIALPTR